MNNHSTRIEQYSEVATSLACFSNKKLTQLIAGAEPMHEGIGGKSALISINDTLVFVKKIPLTDLEQLPQNVMSTANLFELPLGYQYGVGSTGFGAWRELAAHIMTTNWVITGKCTNFPIIYHWRVMLNEPGDINVNYWGNIEKYSQYWENCSAIRKRIEALNKASAHIALFLEYIPQNLQGWLRAKISKGGDSAEAAAVFVDENLKIANTYMNSHGLIHFDAHFENILTDGELLYISDFGLALSLKFELTTAETTFLNYHQTYDQACAAVNLLHCIITSLFGKEQWEKCLHETIAGECPDTLPTLATIIKRYAPIALLMNEFFQKLQKESKSAQYPAIKLEKSLTISSSRTI